MRGLRMASCLLGLVGSLSWAGGAQASPLTVTFDGTIASAPPELTGFADPGNPFSLQMYVDSATPNEGTSPDFQATSPGSVYSFLIVDIYGSLDSVTATAGTGTWSANGVFSIAGYDLPYAMAITGTGLTPGQILPDFSSFTGTITIDLMALAPALSLESLDPVVANVDSITIAAPEPATAVLVAVALSGVALALRWNA